MLRTFVLPMLAFAALAIVAGEATAYPQFRSAFLKLYVKDSDNQEFADRAKDAKCLLCHQSKADKPGKPNLKEHNVYGLALDELLDKGDRKDKEKIAAALEQVAEMPSDPDDDSSPTFGELIAEGKLPAGPLADESEGDSEGSGSK